MKASDLFVKVLEEKWIQTIYGVPGEENLDLLNSLKDSKIELVLPERRRGKEAQKNDQILELNKHNMEFQTKIKPTIIWNSKQQYWITTNTNMESQAKKIEFQTTIIWNSKQKWNQQ